MKRYIIEVDQFCDGFDNGEKQALLKLTQEQEVFAKWLLSQDCFNFATLTEVDKMVADFDGKEVKQI